MKSRLVDTVTSTEENLRLRIYDGTISLDAAGQDLLEGFRNDLRLAHARIKRLDEEIREQREHIESLEAEKQGRFEAASLSLEAPATS